MERELIIVKNSECYSVIKKILLEIDDQLEKNNHLIMVNNLASGRAGISLFYYYLGLMYKSDAYIKKSIKYIEDAFNNMNNYNTSFHGGICGIFFVYQHLKNSGQLNEIKELNFKQLDELFLNEAIKEYKNNNFDLLYGYIGYGTYFIERIVDNNNYSYVDQILSFLFDSKIKLSRHECSWVGHLNTDIIKNEYNLGLAHGVPSIISFLCNLYKSEKTSRSIIYELLNESISWLIKQKYTDVELISYPYSINFDGIKGNPSRLAWCYGDLSISFVLIKAGQLTNNNEWLNEGICLAVKTTKRDLALSGANDASICHGTSGIAHIYNHLYNATNVVSFKTSAYYWFNQTINLYNTKGFDGFKYYTYNKETNETCWNFELGLLEGISGIGLSLISAISSIRPKWDSCLLLSYA